MERRKGRGEEGWKERRELGEEERRKGGGEGRTGRKRGVRGRGEEDGRRGGEGSVPSTISASFPLRVRKGQA